MKVCAGHGIEPSTFGSSVRCAINCGTLDQIAALKLYGYTSKFSTIAKADNLCHFLFTLLDEEAITKS